MSRANCKFTTSADGTHILQSYDTLVAVIDVTGGFHRLWDGWSSTTMRHVRKFIEIYAPGMGKTMPKAKWEAMPVETLGGARKRARARASMLSLDVDD